MKFNLLVIASILIGSSTSASALVDAQLLLGQRFAKFKSDGDKEDVNATEVGVAAHVSPLPIFGLGLYFTNHNFKVDNKDIAFDELKGTQLGAEVTADFPLSIFDLGVYGKAGYTFYGKYTGKFDFVSDGDPVISGEVEANYKVTGYKLGVGLKWSPIAIVSGLIEFNYGAEKWKLDEAKINGKKSDTDGVNFDQTFSTVLVGVEAAI